MGWDLNELRKSVELCFGRAQRNAMSDSLGSMHTRLQHCEFHLCEFIKLEEKAVQGFSSKQLVAEILKFDESRTGEISFEASAHAIAAVQALHSVSDITGCVLALSLREGTEWTGYLREVCNSLGKISDELAPLVNSLRSHDDYVYLDALVNQTKHRNVVSPYLVADLTGNENNRYAFITFTRKEKIHPPRDVKNFLIGEYNRQAKQFFEIINKLNSIAYSQRPQP